MSVRHYQGSRILSAFLVLVALAAVGWPAIGVLWSTVRGAVSSGAPAPDGPDVEPALSMVPSVPLLLSTLAWAVGIGVGATILAWPAAWVIRRRGWGIMALVAT